MSFTELTWESLAGVAAMGLVVAALMLLLLKPLISLIFAVLWDRFRPGEEYSKRADQLLGLLINTVTLLLSWGLSYWRLYLELAAGPIFLHGLQTMVVAVAEYEVSKNVLGALGKDISRVLVRTP